MSRAGNQSAVGGPAEFQALGGAAAVRVRRSCTETAGRRRSGRVTDYTQLPADLPVPEDDGAADHLPGRRVPDVTLAATSGEAVALREVGPGRTIVYVYPMTGQPDVALPEGWDEIPGARGCTTEACDFRDHHAELLDAGAASVRPVQPGHRLPARDGAAPATSRSACSPTPISSSPTRLELPTFEAAGTTLYKRITLVLRDDAIEHVFYPIFPPNEHAGEVLRLAARHVPSVGVGLSHGRARLVVLAGRDGPDRRARP